MIWRGFSIVLGAWIFLSASSATAGEAGCLASEAVLKALMAASRGLSFQLSAKVNDYPLRSIRMETLRPDGGGAGRMGWSTIGPGQVAPISPPSKGMAQAFLDQAHVGAAACSDVLEFASRSAIAVGERAGPQPPLGALYGRTYIELTRAVVSPDGAEAIAYFTSVSGPLAGHGMLLLTRRDERGDWAVVGQLPIWVA